MTMSPWLAALCLAGPASPAAPVDLEAERAAVQRADSAMSEATARRDLAGFLAFLSEDVWFIPNGAETAVGRDGVARLWAALFQERGPTLTWRPTEPDVASSGDLAYTRGEFESKGTDREGKPSTRTGRYLTVWRKQVDGSWRVAVDTSDPGPPPAGSSGFQATRERGETAKAGDLDYAVGRFEATDADGKPILRRGRYVEVRRRGSDGGWRVVASAAVP
ncbi:MAG: hypothetical protein DMF80_07745 [Acidobacteria bacterium]|nr:MAG: hypothetical protein DMF80_07745 [Acidobacteriota bacterium]